jgi:hypothetical protein
MRRRFLKDWPWETVTVGNEFGENGMSGAGTYLTSTELYNPASGTRSTTGLLNTPRAFHTATLLSNGQVLVAGGNNMVSITASSEADY